MDDLETGPRAGGRTGSTATATAAPERTVDGEVDPPSQLGAERNSSRAELRRG